MCIFRASENWILLDITKAKCFSNHISKNHGVVENFTHCLRKSVPQVSVVAASTFFTRSISGDRGCAETTIVYKRKHGLDSSQCGDDELYTLWRSSQDMRHR